MKGACKAVLFATGLALAFSCAKQDESSQFAITFEKNNVDPASTSGLLAVVTEDSHGSIRVVYSSGFQPINKIGLDTTELPNDPNAQIVVLTYQESLVGVTPYFAPGTDRINPSPLDIFYAPLKSGASFRELGLSDIASSLAGKFSKMVMINRPSTSHQTYRYNVASGASSLGPDPMLNNLVVDLSAYGFSATGPKPHFIVSERDYNVTGADGNSLTGGSYCGFQEIASLQYKVSCWVVSNLGNKIASSFDWFAIQEPAGIASNPGRLRIASDQDLLGPSAQLNKLVTDLEAVGFDPNGPAPMVITSIRDFNPAGIANHSLDAAYCSSTLTSSPDPFGFIADCWASPARGYGASDAVADGQFQSSFDFLAIQLPAVSDPSILLPKIILKKNMLASVTVSAPYNIMNFDLSTDGFVTTDPVPNVIVTQVDYNTDTLGLNFNVIDKSYCGYTATGPLTYNVDCWAGVAASSFDFLAIQPPP